MPGDCSFAPPPSQAGKGRIYDSTLRREVLTTTYGTNVLQAADFDDDTAGRLWKIKHGSQEAVYGLLIGDAQSGPPTNWLTKEGVPGSFGWQTSE